MGENKQFSKYLEVDEERNGQTIYSESAGTKFQIYIQNLKETIHKATYETNIYIKNMRETTQEETDEANNDEEKLKKWISEFRKVTTTAASEDVYQTLLSQDDIESVDKFQDYVLEKMENWNEELKEHFENTRKDTVNFHGTDPYQTAVDACW